MIMVESARTINQLGSLIINLRTRVSETILRVGDQAVIKLQEQFPDLSFISNFFPENLEYWITIVRAGKELTKIKCPVSKLFFTRDRDEFGNQEFRSDVALLDLDKITDDIANELSLQIRTIRIEM